MKKGTCHHDKLPALRRIEGQVRGIQKMIDEERYCVDILYAVGAAIGALKKVETALLKDHLDSCVRGAFLGSSPRERQTKLKEINDLLSSVRR